MHLFDIKFFWHLGDIWLKMKPIWRLAPYFSTSRNRIHRERQNMGGLLYCDNKHDVIYFYWEHIPTFIKNIIEFNLSLDKWYADNIWIWVDMGNCTKWQTSLRHITVEYLDSRCFKLVFLRGFQNIFFVGKGIKPYKT